MQNNTISKPAKKNYKSKDLRYIVSMTRLLYAIEYLGRFCKMCHFDGFIEPWFMDFHHTDRESKGYEVKNQIMHGRFERMKPEIDKCEILCGRCHRKLHSSEQTYQRLSVQITNKLLDLTIRNGDFRTHREFTEGDAHAVTKLAAQGMSITEIADEMGKEYHSVKYRLRKLGIKCVDHRAKRAMKFPQEKIEQLLSEGMSCREIAKQIGINRTTITAFAKTNHPKISGSDSFPASGALASSAKTSP